MRKPKYNGAFLWKIKKENPVTTSFKIWRMPQKESLWNVSPLKMVLRDSFCWKGQVQEQDQGFHSHQREWKRYPGHQSVDWVYHWRQQWWCSFNRWRLFKGCVPALVYCCTRLSVGMMLRHKEPMIDKTDHLNGQWTIPAAKERLHAVADVLHCNESRLSQNTWRTEIII